MKCLRGIKAKDIFKILKPPVGGNKVLSLHPFILHFFFCNFGMIYLKANGLRDARLLYFCAPCHCKTTNPMSATLTENLGRLIFFLSYTMVWCQPIGAQNLFHTQLLKWQNLFVMSKAFWWQNVCHRRHAMNDHEPTFSWQVKI